MNNRRPFRQREQTEKTVNCACGGKAKLSKRRVFPHGRKSGGLTIVQYVCKECKKRTPVFNEAPAKRR